MSHAELVLLLNFDQAELYKFEQARELSISLLKEWLANYKFRDWNKTLTRGRKVDNGMRSRRAASIARKLNDTGRWHSHGYGISMDVLTRDIDLKIDDFGADRELSDAIRGYHQLFEDYSAKLGLDVAIHIDGEFMGIHGYHH